MTKRKVKKEIPLTRKQISRREKERRQRLTLIAIAAAIGSLILAVLAYGAYQELIAKPAAPVAVVNGVPISTETYQKRVLWERSSLDSAIQRLAVQRSALDSEGNELLVSFIDQQLSQLYMQRDLLNGEALLDQLIEEELIRQAAQERGVVASSDEVDQRIEELFGYSPEDTQPTPSPSTATITPTTEITPTAAPTPMTRARFEELYGEYLAALQEGTGLSESDYRQIVATQILREKLMEFVAEQVPTRELHIRTRHILLETEEEAQAALERLEQGEDFQDLARKLSQDTLTADLGGDLGWLAQGRMDTPFDEVAFSLQPGQVSDVVETYSGFEIILVEERDEERELDASLLDLRIQEAFEVWLFDLRSTAEIQRYWSQDKVPPE